MNIYLWVFLSQEKDWFTYVHVSNLNKTSYLSHEDEIHAVGCDFTKWSLQLPRYLQYCLIVDHVKQDSTMIYYKLT